MDSALGIAVGIVASIVGIICWMLIFSKAGYSKWRGLLMMIPMVNVVLFLIFAFSDWPVLSAKEKVNESPRKTGQHQPGDGRSKKNMPPSCPKCGAPFTAEDKFCGDCGFPRQQ